MRKHNLKGWWDLNLLPAPAKLPCTHLCAEQTQSGQLPPAGAAFGAAAEDRLPSRPSCAQRWGRPAESSVEGLWGDWGIGAWLCQWRDWQDTESKGGKYTSSSGLVSDVCAPCFRSFFRSGLCLGLPWRCGTGAGAWGEKAGRMSAHPLPDRNQETQIRFSHRASGRGTHSLRELLPSWRSWHFRAELKGGPGHQRASLRA